MLELLFLAPKNWALQQALPIQHDAQLGELGEHPCDRLPKSCIDWVGRDASAKAMKHHPFS